MSESFLSSLPLLLDGLTINLILTVLATCGAIFGGAILAVMRISNIAVLSLISATYVNAFRAMPLILVLFWFYFLVPSIIGRPVGGFQSALIAFVLFEAAYFSEIIRSGIRALSGGQTAAGLALGLTKMQVMRNVILPQAFRNMLPVLMTQSIILFQDTSLVYVIGLRDFLTTADVIAQRDGSFVEIYLSVALFYLVFCAMANLAVSSLRQRLGVSR